ncbi:MAG: UvrD-helicase domain-containing protein, partial [Thermoguttaceae bacterium]
MNQLLEGLTEAQREAVTQVDGQLLILAGPGSGKTRVITHRVAWMLYQGIPAEQILALTFTNKAAEEMRGRVEQLAPGKSVWLGTFHRFCARLLRKYAPLVGLRENYTIYDTTDSRQALCRVIGRVRDDSAGLNPDAIAKAISWAKNRLVTPEKFEPKPGDHAGLAARDVYPAYQAYLSSVNAADFDDLLLHVATLLRENPEVRRGLDQRYRYVMVDEYQDTNAAQYVIARAMSIDHPNLAVTGDPDQSIYSWRGANMGNILEFEKDYPEVKVVRLERNYRSTKRILSVADQLISHNVHRKEKTLYTENGDGSPVRLVFYQTQKDEAEAIAARMAAEIHSGRRRPSDFAVFYRVNALSRAFEFALRELGVPYQMVNGLEFFQRREIKDALAYLHLLNNPRDDVALLRVINRPARGIGKTTVGRISDHALHSGLSMLEAAREARQIATLGKRAAGLVEKFAEMFDRLTAVIDEPVEEIVGNVLDGSGYRKYLKDSGTEEDMQRLDNIEELLTVARDYDERTDGGGQLEGFLEETCLVNDTDAWEVDSDRVTLMTLHAAKGLEFPVVYMVAVEEGLLPHERSRDNPRELEEERR